MTNDEERAKAATKAIIANLENRSGVGNELEAVDREIKKEIEASIAKIILKHMCPQ